MISPGSRSHKIPLEGDQARIDGPGPARWSSLGSSMHLESDMSNQGDSLPFMVLVMILLGHNGLLPAAELLALTTGDVE